MISDFHKRRKNFKPSVINVFRHSLSNISLTEKDGIIGFKTKSTKYDRKLRNICVVLSGGPAPGGHNVICGIYDFLIKNFASSQLFGAVSGCSGIIDGNLKEINRNTVNSFINTGGFDMTGTGRTKLSKESQFDSVIKVCRERDINALVIIGGDDSNTNAAIMDEYFKKKGEDITVVGVPKTIDGDLKNENIEVTFGFDTAVRVYSEMIGNIQRDAESSRKYYHFIRLMGRDASHITLECALLCRPNLTLISEEVREKNMSLDDIAEYIANTIRHRNECGFNYGVCLVPEGIIEAISDIRTLIDEINSLIAANPGADRNRISEKLSPASTKTLHSFPSVYQEQLFSRRDAHGNVQISNIESEKIIAEKVKEKLKSNYFDYRTHFFGYEGRCAFPTNFDCIYTYNLGIAASVLCAYGKSGYIVFVKNLGRKFREWTPGAMPLSSLLTTEIRNGKESRVIRKTLVDLNSAAYLFFKENRGDWAMNNRYQSTGPVQFCDKDIEIPFSLELNSRK